MKDIQEFNNALSTNSLIEQLKSNSTIGLTHKEAEAKLKQYGKNTLAREEKWIVLKRFIKAWLDPLSLILLCAAIISYVSGEVSDALIIFLIVGTSSLLNFFQEEKAERAAQSLQKRIHTTCTVLRDGKEHKISARLVVPGDILLLKAGNLIPADGRLLESTDCFVNQSALTGESFPQEKKAVNTPIEETTNITDQNYMIFAGTSLVSGMGKAIITATGKSTELGKIAVDINGAKIKSSFEQGISVFSMNLTKVTLMFVLLVFAFTIARHEPLFHAFMFAIAIGVGLTPELLPMILTLTMSAGSLHMAKKGVIMKRLSSIPTLGSMDILCTDKTGTLTEDKIALVKYIDIHGKENPLLLTYAYLISAFQQSIANPLDNAVLHFTKQNTDQFTKKGELPFDFSRRKMSVLVEEKDKQTMLITKGAPEEVFLSSSHILTAEGVVTFDTHAKDTMSQLYGTLSDEGYRVLALGYKAMKSASDHITTADEEDLILIGFLAFLDPPKSDVSSTIIALKKAGVDLKIITGDNERVTLRICKELGVPVQGVLLGSELTTMTDDALRIRAEQTTIFARCSPDQKNRIIGRLQERGHTVGYMGDGINDAPSLHHADVGISVENAVDVAKDTAPVILTEKNLQVLLDGIIEGRKTFANSMKYLMMGVSSNFGNMFSVMASLLIVPFLPMLPIQILLNNLMYDVSQMTLPKDYVDEETLHTPQHWNHAFIKTFMYIFGGVSSIFDVIGFLIFLWWFHTSPELFRTAWFLQSLATQTGIILFVRTKKIPFLQSSTHPLLLVSTIITICLGWLIPFSPIGHWFGFVTPSLPLLGAIFGLVVTYFCTVEITKQIFYRFSGNNVNRSR